MKKVLFALMGIFLMSCAAIPSIKPAEQTSPCQVVFQERTEEVSKAFLSYFNYYFSPIKLKDDSSISLQFIGNEFKRIDTLKEFEITLVRYLMSRKLRALERNDNILTNLAYEESGKNVKGIPASPPGPSTSFPDNTLRTSDYNIAIELLSCKEGDEAKNVVDEKTKVVMRKSLHVVTINTVVSIVDSKSGEYVWIGKVNPRLENVYRSEPESRSEAKPAPKPEAKPEPKPEPKPKPPAPKPQPLTD